MNTTSDADHSLVIVHESQKRLTAVDIRAQVNLIQEVMGAVMKKNVHYGIIQGCKQPSLYKAGSEVLLTTFRISVIPEVEDISKGEEIRYRVKAKGVHIPTGSVVGVGIGECSSMEEKYKWKKASEKEWENTPEDRRRIKYGKDFSSKQVRTEPADFSNTVLKMAKKRAQIDMTLTALAASDCFTQDIEDLPEGYVEEEEPEKRQAPQPYPAEQFSKNLPLWIDLVKTGKKTVEQIIAMVSSRALLSDEQIKKIQAIKKEAQAGAHHES